MIRNISNDTRILIAFAVVGLLVFVFILPGQHPDSIASTELTEADARAAATAFLVKHGYATTNLDSRATLYRWSSVIESVQDTLGRNYLIKNMTPAELESMPMYSWEVVFFRKMDFGGWDRIFSVYLTLSGEVFGFDNQSIFLRRADRVALAELFRNREADESMDSEPDSMRPPSFDFDSGLFPTSFGGVDTTASFFRRGRSNENAGEFLISPEGATAIAQYHLSQFELAGYAFRPDSAWLETDVNGTIANVRFEGSTQKHGQKFVETLAITPRGSLYSIQVDHDSEIATSEATQLELAALAITGISALIILGFLIVSFFRRLIARLIDVKAALIDAFVFSTLLVLSIVVRTDLVFGFSQFPLWGRFVFPLAIGGFVGGGMAVLLFLVTSSADSLARPRWSRQLMSASLLRQGRLMNARVGQALIRGVLLGFVLLGVNTLLLWIIAPVRLDLENALASTSSVSPFLSAIGLHGFLGYVELGVILLGAVAVVRRWSERRVWTLLASVIILAAAQASFPSIRPIGLEWLVSGVVGLVIGVAFIRFDLVTILTGFFSGSLLWSLKEAFLINGSTTTLDFALALLLLIVVLVIGAVGIIRGAPIEGIRDYVPDYIRELRQQERLRHELSIAQQVQESFLPGEMPSMTGIDVAARCLAAEEVGGDYYDFIPVSKNKLALAIGDVSGKGIQAAFFMTLTKGFLQTLCRENHEPAEVLKKINALFCENAPRGMFISMIYGILDVRERTFTFARAGHNPIILKRGGPVAMIELIQPKGLGIGLASSDSFDRSIEQEIIRLGEDDTLVLFTDGFSEAMNPERQLFGDERLSNVIRDSNSAAARGILDNVQKEVDVFVNGAERHDDMTMVVVRFTTDGVAQG